MVSRRNFFSIIMMMAVLLFMFQFSQIIKENASNYDVNEYAAKEPAAAHRPQEGTSGADGGFDRERVVLLGDEGNALGRTVSQWCVYTKRDLSVLTEPDVVKRGADRPDLILIDSGQLDFDRDTEALVELVQSGVPLIFCNLPDTAVLLENPALTELLGISQIREEPAQTEGIHLFSGFLLGGEAVYQVRLPEEAEKQDLELAIPWYVTGKGTKTYMVGMMDEHKVEREDFPRIIWRNSCGNAMVFAVNGSYLDDLTGLGLLDAMVFEMNAYTVYPVVNAQNMLVADFPVLSAENVAGMEAVYSRDPEAVMRDVMWPGITAMALNNKLRLTCFVNAKYDGADAAQPQAETLPFYLQQLREVSAEAGISFGYAGAPDVGGTGHVDGTGQVDGAEAALADKLRSDREFYDALESNYRFAAAYFEVLPEHLEEALAEGAGRLADIRTVAYRNGGEHPLLSWREDGVTLQAVTGDAGEYSYSVDLRMRSLATALGYSNTLIGMHRAMWPESEEDQWENYFDEIFSNVSTYWTKYGGFEQTVMSESDRRIRRFLGLDYEVEREDHRIALSLSGEGDAWFVLRLHDEAVAGMQGGSFQKLEAGAYLIHAEESQVEITLKKADDVLEYAGPFGR
ncbi:MAG: DUF2194 domain-containing protein [Candidatus Gastranaerophilales bacterium]|nr:DUF2194 domain-containing protein [Candidatus Gastranaerophilales bacterium]